MDEMSETALHFKPLHEKMAVVISVLKGLACYG